jgi:hypothetical protein
MCKTGPINYENYGEGGCEPMKLWDYLIITYVEERWEELETQLNYNARWSAGTLPWM